MGIDYGVGRCYTHFVIKNVWIRGVKMKRGRFDLFVKNLYFSNHPKSYNGNKILDKMAERKTEKLLWILHDNGINMDKFIEYNLMGIDCQWRYNVVMSAVQDGLMKSRDIKHIIAIDDFIEGMVQEHQSLREQYDGRKYVFQMEDVNVDRYVKSIVVSAVDAMIIESAEYGKDFKSCLNTYECIAANESGVYSSEEVELAKEILELREEYVANGGNEDDFELL